MLRLSLGYPEGSVLKLPSMRATSVGIVLGEFCYVFSTFGKYSNELSSLSRFTLGLSWLAGSAIDEHSLCRSFDPLILVCKDLIT